MTRANLDPPVVVNNGQVLQVLGIARISTVHQDERSLEDQEQLYRSWLDENVEAPYTLRMIASQGSGECLDREEFIRATQLIEGGTIQLVLCEDLGRIVRRVHAHLFCELCEDNNTRLIAINDHVDTARDDWRMSSFFAVFKHESSNKDTSNRIRRSLRNRFMNGGVFQVPIFGYRKPPGAQSDSDVSKDPAAESIYDEWFARLERGQSYSKLADWLNSLGIPTGPGCRKKAWDGVLVRNTTSNPILKGVRVRNRKMAKRVNKTGRRKSVNAPPEELLERHCPHLKFIEPARYDRLIRQLTEKNAKYTVGRLTNHDPRRGRPKKSTIWPGQHIDCGKCRRLFVYGGHGQTDHLMCSGARKHRCWNGISVDGPLAAEKLATAISAEIEAIADFELVYQQQVQEQLDQCNDSRATRLQEIRQQEEKIVRQIANVVDFIADGKCTMALREKFTRLEAERDNLVLQREAIEREPTQRSLVPGIEEIKQLARVAMARQASEPYEFGEVMHDLIARIVVWPYRLCDSPKIVLRARFSLSLLPLLAPTQRVDGMDQVLRRELVVDLFDPPQREAYRKQIVALRADGVTEKSIAQQLGLTITAVQRAASLQRMMDRMGLSDPYLSVNEPPADDKKMRRHLHPRYRFEPLPEVSGG